ncbi:hypothetical protein IWX49DRAFT_594982 [Phyllosticta citricarpa]|uniref:RING-type domain-containing protein n=1 Tax=Phyllosticta citricarpa TaxID=55181 RepID=A0ABR1LC01_9PEZI
MADGHAQLRLDLTRASFGRARAQQQTKLNLNVARSNNQAGRHPKDLISTLLMFQLPHRFAVVKPLRRLASKPMSNLARGRASHVPAQTNRQRKPRRTLPLEPEYEAKYQRLLAERRRPLGLESSFDSILRQAPVEPQQRPQTSAQGADIDLTGLQEPRRQEPFQLSPHASVPVEEDFDPRRHRSSGSIRQRKSRRSLPADPTLLTTTRKASIYEPRQPLQQAAPIESHQQEADRPPSRSGPQFVEEDEWPPHIPSDLPVRVGFRRLYQLDAALAFENDPILASMIEQALAERSQPRPRSKPPPSDVKHEEPAPKPNSNLEPKPLLCNIHETDECSICLDKLVDTALFVAPCKHAWHFSCVGSLLPGPKREDPTFICPNCRMQWDVSSKN